MITTITSNITPPATPPPIAADGNIFDAANGCAVIIEFATVGVNNQHM